MALPLRPLPVVVGPRPERMPDTLARVLVEGLAQELRAEVAPSHSTTLAAPLNDGRDSREASQLVRRLPPLSVRAERYRQPGGVVLTRPRQALHQRKVLVDGAQGGDLCVELLDER